jgi:hypothetical protein
MTLTTPHHPGLRLFGGTITFALIALSLQVNSGLDRVIQSGLMTLTWCLRLAVDYLLEAL